jgi:RNA polymerase sigma-70 factor (ECF subfamily)
MVLLKGDHFRKKKWEFSGVDDHLDFLIDTEAEDSLEQTLRAENIQSALDTLSLEYREVLILSRYHDLKYEEIATMLGCTVGNVKIRVHRAIKALRKAFLSIEQ